MPAGNVLVVDDDSTLAELLQMRLESANYSVMSAQNGNKAISAVKGQVFDLSIVDLRLGEENGITLMEEIHSVMPEMPIIIFTAYGSIEIEVEAMRKGTYSYLSKPFETGDLLFQIERALENRRQIPKSFQ